MAVLTNAKPRVFKAKNAKIKVKDNKKVILVAQEIKLAKILAGNNKTLRDRTLRKLKKWFGARESTLPFTEDDFLRLWKGLFYYMWMSDKPLIQEECAENISQLCHFKSTITSLLFFKCFLKTMAQEWFGIDFLRMDKFLMLVRRVLRQAFEVLKLSGWQLQDITYFQEILSETILSDDKPCGLNMHITDIYLEELCKVSKGRIEPDQVLEMFRPFAVYLASTKDEWQTRNIIKNLFRYLMEQSDIGIDYKLKFSAWKQQGYPGKSIRSMTKVEMNSEPAEEDVSDADEPKDPRAGKVDVVLPQMQFDPKKMADMFLELRFQPCTNTLSRKKLNQLANEFSALNRGNYPIGIKRVAVVKNDGYSTGMKASLQRLQNFEQQFTGETKRAKEKLMKRRKMKRLVREEIKRYRNEYRENFEKSLQKPATLDDFIKNSEDGISKSIVEKKVKRKKLNNPNTFERNSGVWEVNDVATFVNKTKNKPPENKVEQTKTKRKSLEPNEKPLKVRRKSEPLFKSEWDEPLKDGETEIFIPIIKTKQTKIDKLRNATLTALNDRLSADIVKNPFARTPKKVRIELNLNQSQDKNEYHKQVISSPGIPFDANKRPTKPLLKPSAVSSPINPFYKRKMK